MIAPLDVVLDVDTVVQPDILIARRSDLTERDLPTAPVLAVEVLSPSTRSIDLLLKRARYEAAGATSYWAVDPAEPSITCAEVEAMERRGWVTRRSSLLTEAEGKYFNFFLNKVDFGNGPELRNKYLHGSQANADGEDAHFLLAKEQPDPANQAEDKALDEHEG